jgi:dihydropteroate synthase
MKPIAHARGRLELPGCAVMGIVNRTPDSFYDGGRVELGAGVDHALRLVDEGAHIIDLGAVKAGPGAPVGAAEEAARLLGMVESITSVTDVVLSVETARSEIAASAMAAGAAIINDVSGLADPDLAAVCAKTGAALVLMHHGGQIRGRPLHPRYDDVVADVRTELWRLAGAAQLAGVERESIVIDPGLDFGKTTYHSLEIVRHVSELTDGEYAVLVAPSRKDVIGETLGLPPDERLEGTLALVVIAVLGGVDIVRVHDVKAAVRAVRMAEAVTGRFDPATPLRGLWD